MVDNLTINNARLQELARLIAQEGRKPLLAAADLQRPAAIEQLHVIGETLGVPVYSEPGAQDPVKVCRDAVQRAKEVGAQVLILDTAGVLDGDLLDVSVTYVPDNEPGSVVTISAVYAFDYMTGLLPLDEFRAIVRAASRAVGRPARILAETGASPDHPVALDIPETGYLKALWLLVGEPETDRPDSTN